MAGSNNFTAAGLGLHDRHNIELNVVYLFIETASRFKRARAQSWPPAIKLDDFEPAELLGGETDFAESEVATLFPMEVLTSARGCCAGSTATNDREPTCSNPRQLDDSVALNLASRR